MNSFGVSEFAGRVGDMVKKTLTGDDSRRGTPSPPVVRPRDFSIMNEQYFAGIDSTFSSLCSEYELELAIKKCRLMILDSEEGTDRRYSLIRKLVELRWNLEELKNGPQSPSLEKSFTVMGHVFVSCRLDQTDSYCEKCCTRIWDFVNLGPNQYYTCDKCRYKCHQRCLNSITRSCTYLRTHEYELRICPEMGLSVQQFKCFECRASLLPLGLRLLPQVEAYRRLCDSCGRWFCSYCHWNTEMTIPARVIHNWDFKPRKICRGCVQFLRIMIKRPVLDVEKLNPFLFAHVEELPAVKMLREDLQQMKHYLTNCHIAQSKKLLWLLNKRRHFVENSHMYSMQDLKDLEAGTLMKYLQQVLRVYEVHITKECESCVGKGYHCQLCSSKEVIFPLSRELTSRCPDCLVVYHRECFRNHKGFCPRCERISRRVSMT